MSTYYDTSALVKLTVSESQSDAMRAYWLAHPSPISSAIARTELLRAVRNETAAVRLNARTVLASLDLIGLDDSLLESAANLDPQILRTLDAIHVATALSLGNTLDELVTYDRRMAGAAECLGLKVVSP